MRFPRLKTKKIMKKGTLVFNKENGQGLIIKTSPSGSLVEVKFQRHAICKVVLNSSLTIIK